MCVFTMYDNALSDMYDHVMWQFTIYDVIPNEYGVMWQFKIVIHKLRSTQPTISSVLCI